MTRAQAYQLSVALEGQAIGHSIAFAYDAQGAETATVTLEIGPVYTGLQLAQLTTYCANHGLNLTLTLAYMGIT